MSKPARISPEDVGQWLRTQSRGHTRNVLRGLLRFLASGQPACKVVGYIANVTGLKDKAVSASLLRLRQHGLVQTLSDGPGHPLHWISVGRGHDAAKLRAILGDTMEKVPVAPTCPTCHRQVVAGQPCWLCAKIAAEGPWLEERLDYLSERAAARLPLFDPPPPWLTSAHAPGSTPDTALVLAAFTPSEEEDDE